MTAGFAYYLGFGIGVLGWVSIALVVLVELRRTPQQEVEMIRREDEAMSKIEDEPNEPAWWVP